MDAISEPVNRTAKLLTVLEDHDIDRSQKIEDHSIQFDQGDDIVEFGNSFDFDGYQVVRREFFAHQREPAATFNNCKFYVNSACLRKFPQTNFIQVLINRETKIMALRPCNEGAKDSFPWCTCNGTRKPKQITCKLFFAKIFSLMEWNPNYRYKLLGKLIHANGEYLIAFDLTTTESYTKTITEENKLKCSRIPVFPESWQNQFGLSYKEHRQSMQVDIFDGYAIYSIKEQNTAGLAEAHSEFQPSEAILKGDNNGQYPD